MKNRDVLLRQLRVVHELQRRPGGLTSEKLARQLGSSRPTIDRDLRVLRDLVGLPIERVRNNGEVRHTLRDLPFASLAVTPLQVVALRLAREGLRPLTGTSIVRDLDAMLAHLPGRVGAPRAGARLDVAKGPSTGNPNMVKAIDAAMERSKQLAIRVRVASHGGEERRYTLDPLLLRLVEDELYLFAWAHERGAPRTFKVARIVQAEVLEAAAAQHDDVDVEAAFRDSVKAWSGEVRQVRVRLAAEKAWLIGEYPLVAGQRAEAQADGSVVIEASVAGLKEPLQWVLSWGRHAEVLGPPELRRAVADELAAMLALYTEPGPDRVRSRMVSGVRRRRASLEPRRGASSGVTDERTNR